ncbi:SnoaL-like protein [Pseudonocardia endophytica]|uniref:SnoaL-like protein n=1 Tax=Pseudonocardia endophytica TaxID=401976 RepID=A0A4R1HWU1_PSEEN|nr:SnoaL-like protein [Pseudonocardia endophytica]
MLTARRAGSSVRPVTTSATDLETRVRAYMDACTSGDAAAVASHLTTDAVHYFPPDMYDGPWRGAVPIGEKWAEKVRTGRSAWTVDAIAVDAARRVAVCEWTHFKQAAGVLLRGTEWYEFDGEGLIAEIRAYYASPQDTALARLELGGFDYAGRGYPEAPRAAVGG